MCVRGFPHCAFNL